jgi:phospholipid transport system substrate-binding protein
MKLRYVLSTLLVLGSTAIARPAAESARDTIQRGNTRFRSLLGRRVDPGSPEEHKLSAQMTTDMRTLFDVRDLTRRAMADHWEALSEGQRTDLVDTLQKLVERSYIRQLRANLKYEVDYGSEAPQGDGVLVKTAVKAEQHGRPMTVDVDYLMHDDAGHWRVYDVITDDVSMLRNYRSQFARIIKREGAAGLLDRMHKKLADEADAD